MKPIRTFIQILLVIIPALTYGQLNITHWLNSGRDKIIDNDNVSAIEYFNTLLKFVPDLDEAYYLRAVSKYNLGDYRGALDDLNKSISIRPYYSYYYLYRGEVKNKLFDLVGAREDFDKAIELKANNADAYIGRGINSMMQKKYEEAISDFNTAISLDKKNPYAFLYRAIAKQSIERYEDARVDFDKAIQLNPFTADFYTRRGRNFMLMKAYTQAIEDFNYAISIDSINSFAYFNRAMAYYEMGDSIKTLHDLNKVIELDPQNALAYFNRAEIKTRLNDLYGAIDDYSRVIEINPNNVFTYFNRGIVYFTLRNYKKAIADYSKAIELNPEFVAAYYNRSIAKKQMGDLVGAKSDFTKALKINTEKNQNRETNLDSTQLAKIITFKADFEKGNITVTKTIEKGINSFPNFEVTFIPADSAVKRKISLSEKYIYIDDKENKNYLLISYKTIELSIESINRLDSIFELERKNDTSEYGLLTSTALKALQQNYNDAIEKCNQLIAQNPNNVYAYLTRGTLRFKFIQLVRTIQNENLQYYYIGDPQKERKDRKEIPVDFTQVISDYQTCISIDPNFAYAYYNLANVEIENTNFDKALQLYTKAIEKLPNFPEAYFNRGLLNIFLKKTEDGCRDLSKSGELGISLSYIVIKKYCND